MKLKYYHVDAFTKSSGLFTGNPAGVCLLDSWLEDAMLLSIARENNVSETAFIVKSADQFNLRWFSPKMEIDLCGHATLASAFVCFNHENYGKETITFQTQSGLLSVTRDRELLSMEFPSRKPFRKDAHISFEAILGAAPREVWMSRDLMLVYDNEEQIFELNPDFNRLIKLDGFGVIVTAPGRNVDFVSRFFVPKAGVDEDPVTGSAHCTLIPYWSELLGKNQLSASQLSVRGGELFCQNKETRVVISGRAMLYMTGTIHVSG